MKTLTENITSNLVFLFIVLLAILFLSSIAHAATIYLDDFEDGDYNGWLVTLNQSTGPYATDVQLHNSSMMAYVLRTGATDISLSQDFSYNPGYDLSFDMEAHATGAGSLDATSGVTFSFLNSLNATLGTFTIANATDPTSLGTYSSLVDSAQHTYDITFSEIAALAGLGATDSVSKINISFFAAAEAYCNIGGCSYSSSHLWFDNVMVSSIPIPATAWLFGSGLIGLVGIARRKRAS